MIHRKQSRQYVNLNIIVKSVVTNNKKTYMYNECNDCNVQEDKIWYKNSEKLYANPQDYLDMAKS